MIKQLKILVVGATGQQGGSVARALLNKGHNVRALTRNATSPKAKTLAKMGATIYQGDLENKETLINAMRGVDSVFGMTTPYEAGVKMETRHGVSLVNAARQVGIRHLVFSSVSNANIKTGIPHFDSKFKIEKHLMGSGVPYTIIAPVFFYENWQSQWFMPPLKEGKVALAMPPDRKLAHISTQDIGRFAALVLESRHDFLNKRYDIASDELTGEEIANKLGRYLNKKFTYQRVPIETLRRENEEFALMFEWFNNVGYNVDIQTLRHTYPQVGWTRFDEWIRRQDWSTLGLVTPPEGEKPYTTL